MTSLKICPKMAKGPQWRKLCSSAILGHILRLCPFKRGGLFSNHPKKADDPYSQSTLDVISLHYTAQAAAILVQEYYVQPIECI